MRTSSLSDEIDIESFKKRLVNSLFGEVDIFREEDSLPALPRAHRSFFAVSIKYSWAQSEMLLVVDGIFQSGQSANGASCALALFAPKRLVSSFFTKI